MCILYLEYIFSRPVGSSGSKCVMQTLESEQSTNQLAKAFVFYVIGFLKKKRYIDCN